MGLNSEKFTGNTALSHTVTFECPAHLDEVRLTLNSACSVAEPFTITLDSGYGAAYDVLLYSQNLNGIQDLVAIGTEETRFKATDALNFAWTNTDGFLYGMEVRYIT